MNSNPECPAFNLMLRLRDASSTYDQHPQRDDTMRDLVELLSETHNMLSELRLERMELIDTMRAHIVPTGISGEEAMLQIIGILDRKDSFILKVGSRETK